MLKVRLDDTLQFEGATLSRYYKDKNKLPMTYTIKRKKHRAWPFRFGLFWNKSHISELVCFDESCKYEIEGEDQFDTNKLFGIGYLPSHQKESARFGWRYNHITGNIGLSAYCYVKGERIIWDSCEAKIGEWYLLTIVITEDYYHFIVSKDGQELEHDQIKKFHKKRFGYRLGLFFGGNKTAPHKMKIQLEKHD